jgi:hypothetical protein
VIFVRRSVQLFLTGWATDQPTDPAALAARIIHMGRVRRGEAVLDIEPGPPQPPAPRALTPEEAKAMAEAIVAAGKRARGET